MGRIKPGVCVLGGILIVILIGCNAVALKTYIKRMTNFEGVVYVCQEAGDDLNRGVVPEEPLLTIQMGIEKAAGYITDGLADAVDVYVAGGTFEVNYRDGINIILVEGVSLYGGYSSDFSTRDPDTYPTIITDLSDSGGIAGDTNQAVTVPSGVTGSTVLDGFTVRAGGGDLSTAVYIVTSSPVVSNNIIYGGTAGIITAAVSSVDSARPDITGNTIHGGYSSGVNIGVYATRESLAVIDDNIIIGGSSGNSNVGVLIEVGSNVTITHNDIDGGEGNLTQAVQCSADTRMTLEGNRLYGGTAATNAFGVKDQGLYNRIDSNFIHGGSSTDGFTAGIAMYTDSGSNIYNNVVIGGHITGAGSSAGIECRSPDGKIYNNTIAGGDGGESSGILLSEDAAPDIRNNIIFCLSTSGCCILENNPTQSASTIANNCLWDSGGSTDLYEDYLDTIYSDAVTINSLGYASGNISLDPVLTNYTGADGDIHTMNDNDWRPVEGAEVELRQGGLDGVFLNWAFNDDILGEERSNLADGPDEAPSNTDAGGWSMGAYEID